MYTNFSFIKTQSSPGEEKRKQNNKILKVQMVVIHLEITSAINQKVINWKLTEEKDIGIITNWRMIKSH